MSDQLLSWYYPDITSEEAFEMLKSEPVGTFLLRSSTDCNALFTLSVRTAKVVLNIRIYRELNGKIYLDIPNQHRQYFTDRLALIQYYMRGTHSSHTKDSDGHKSYLSFTLQKPLERATVPRDILEFMTSEHTLPYVTRPKDVDARKRRFCENLKGCSIGKQTNLIQL